MPVWGLAKKSVRVFLNFSFGQFFSQPLSDEQVVVTAKGVGCKDIYFNIKKINAILAERGIPLVLCVAYISELVISLPWSIELNGVDLVVQASPNGCRPTEDDALLNSMISSMTAAAFAAAKVTDGSNSWFRTHTHSFSSDEDDGSDNEDDENAITDEDSGKSSGLISRVQRFFERLTKTAEKANFDKNKSDSVVDQDSKERVVYMIDSLIAQTTVVLRNVSIRIECQLGLPGLNRASGITLCFQYLSLANQSSVSQNLGGIQRNDPDARSPKDVHGKFGSQTDVNYNTNSDGWSWMWPFGHARKQTSDTTTTTRTQTSTASGSLSTMLHKIIRLEGADVLWDLWDSTPKRDGSRTRRCGSRAMTTASGASASSSDGESSRGSIRDRRGPFTEFSEEADEEPEAPIPGPTEENVAASAKLLTLPGDEHTARVSMRCPLLALAARSTAGGDIEASARDCSTHATTTPGAPSSSSPDPWSAFELRVHLDIGPIVACVCPTQFYWLQLTVGQLNHIFQVYQDNVSTRASSLQPVGQCDMMPRPVNVIDPEETRWYPAAHQILPYEECVSNHQSECDLVDLDLSESGTKSRAFIDSKLFWSCVTDSPEDVFDGEGYYKQRSQCSNAAKHMTGQPEPSPIADPKFSLAANVLCCALVIFYEDEPVRNVDEPLASPSSTIAGSPPSDTAVFRRSMMHRSTMIESTRSIIEQSDSANEDDKVDCPVASEPDGSVTVEPKCGSLNTTVNTAAASCKLAALPGPFEFFARFHGLRPWRQPQPSESPTPPGPFKRSRSTATLSGATSYAQLTSPMRIDRYEVDTGQMTPSVWVAHLRRQFAELASPRDHLCFIGGLWHVEFCTRSLTAPATRGLTSRSDSIQGSSTEFGAQLFGFELSECLFPDPMVGEPKIYEVSLV
ncbi:hypothetical protein D915_002064 [Fasciola hepatica]|uniref:Uncharacterized protein n=1 Tax=Fasciola hepatica TaxID=6192 RepID=A0A4E0RYA6_FASHE|nr:hypothetical protein D915_002064 [Fasciola hepatica]